jgi:hypothetical protein
MSPNRAALALLVVGLVLLPGPAYAFGLDRLDGPDRYRSSAGYVATPIEAENDTVLAERYAAGVTFRTPSLKYRHVAEEHRAPNETRRVLERAIRAGSTTTDSPAVREDLRRIQRNHSFVTVSYDAYYTYSTSTDGDVTTVETTRANDSEIAAVVRENRIVDYEDLSEDEQETFRKIREATESEEQYDYRPWSDEPVPERPIVERNGTYYAVEVASHTDDFNFPDGLFLGLAASGVGIVLLLSSGVVGLYGRYRD